MDTQRTLQMITEGLVEEIKKQYLQGRNLLEFTFGIPETLNIAYFLDNSSFLTLQLGINELMNGQVGYDLLRQIVDYRTVKDVKDYPPGDNWLEALVCTNSYFKLVPHSVGYGWEFRDKNWCMVSKTFASPLLAVWDFLGQLDTMLESYTAHKISEFVIEQDKLKREQAEDNYLADLDF